MSVVIVVVEGPSAAGKSTWCAARCDGRVLHETEPGTRPAPSSVPQEAARFWSEINERRWAQAVRVEREHGCAVCDTDPLKLHYDYCLARLGLLPWEQFENGVAFAAEAIADRRVGIADVVLLEIPDDETLKQRRDSDRTRSRRNFDLHRRLGFGLREWYGALDRLDPGRISWTFPDVMPAAIERERYDSDLFTAWMASLPRDPDPSGCSPLT